LYAVRDENAALDIIQEAMLKLTERYADRPANELPMLFQRIVQNATHDHFRRQKVRNTWTRPFSSFFSRDDEDEQDVLEMLESQQEDRPKESPEAQVNQLQTLAEIETALQKLPARQREAFLLRYWEELDVAETAAAMGCSEGSVKTHCSRAVHALASTLRSRGVKL
jgi:RNA polymerase sigma-70 factor (ECF subfamily)